MTAESNVRPWLQRYLNHEELTGVLQGWAARFPDVVRLRALAHSPEGRAVWLLEIGREPDRLRPAVWVDANMHAAELLGTNAALSIAAELLDVHRQPGSTSPVREAARNGLYYIVPRLSPDGAEEVLASRRITRSAPRAAHHGRDRAHWKSTDLDGDGVVRQLRLRHPSGEFVSHPRWPHVMVPRTIDDAGPFYKVFPEASIENFDGVHIPAAHALSDNSYDFNRNFPFAWSGTGSGAGEYPGSAPETQAILEFAARAPHIFAWLNFHTFGGVFIRPPFAGGDDSLPSSDLAVYKLLARRAEAHTGLQTIGAFAEMTPNPRAPMTGTLPAWAYGQRGCFAWAIELWDVFGAAGIARRRPFHLNYALQTREEIAKLVEWDLEHNHGRIFGEWKPVVHPQLGQVEVGGLCPVIGFWNPYEGAIEDACAGVASFAVELSSYAPRIELEASVSERGPQLFEVRLSVHNTGYLPTYVTAETSTCEWNAKPTIQLSTEGCKLIAGPSMMQLEHLAGWGRGDDEETDSPYFQRSQGIRGVPSTWFVSGAGTLTFRVGCPRTGWVLHAVAVG